MADHTVNQPSDARMRFRYTLKRLKAFFSGQWGHDSRDTKTDEEKAEAKARIDANAAKGSGDITIGPR